MQAHKASRAGRGFSISTIALAPLSPDRVDQSSSQENRWRYERAVFGTNRSQP